MSLKHYAAANTIAIVVALTLLFRPVPVQAQSCMQIYAGSGGWQPVTVNVPAWATQLKLNVTWEGLQLRFWFDGTIIGTGMFGQPEIWSLEWPWLPGVHEVELTGIMVQYIGPWVLYACGNAPPPSTPTPSPTPTRTPIPWPTYTVLAPICETSAPVPLSGLGAEYVAIGSSVTIYPDEGASGDPETVYEVINPGMPYGVRYTGRMTLPLVQQALIRVVGGSGFGVPFVWVEVTMCTFGIDLRPTPLAVQPDDIKEVVAGAQYVGTTCYTIMPSISVTIPIPFGDPVSYEYDGFGVCLRKYNLTLRWGDWDAIAIAFPIIAFAFLWAIFLIFRRG